MKPKSLIKNCSMTCIDQLRRLFYSKLFQIGNILIALFFFQVKHINCFFRSWHCQPHHIEGRQIRVWHFSGGHIRLWPGLLRDFSLYMVPWKIGEFSMFSLFLPNALFMTDTYSHYKTNAIVKIIQKDPELVEMSIFMNDDSSFSQVEVRSADNCPKL